MFKAIKNIFALMSQAFRDINAFFKFKKSITEAMDTPQGMFYALKLNRNKFGNILWRDIDIPEQYDQAGEDMIYYYLVDMVKPIFNWLQVDMNWSEYIVFNFYKYVDKDNPNNKTYTYHVEFEFVPIALTQKKLYWYFILTLGLIGGGIWALMTNWSALLAIFGL